MWTNYSIRYMKENKIASLFLAVISLVASVLLSLLGGIFYNLWVDRVYRKMLQGESATEKIEPTVIAYIVIFLVVCISLISMIHHAFEVSMNNRLHQLGILKSVGATPKQIRTILLYEVLILCILPIVCGLLLGIGLCYVFLQIVLTVTSNIRTYEVVFQYHILVALLTFILCVFTVMISAWIPAKRISRLTPLKAIYYGGEQPVKKMKKFRFTSAVFGITGELARKSIYARKKILRTSTLSLTLAFLAFLSFLNLETISRISTRHTYFERYRDKWDVMLVTEERMGAEDSLKEEIRSIPGVVECILYKKAVMYGILKRDMLSQELQSIGIHNLSDQINEIAEGEYNVEVPVFILDNESFEYYCKSNGIIDHSGVVLINKIWNSIQSDRMHRVYIPFVAEKPFSLRITNSGNKSEKSMEIAISSFAQEMPRIKEEFQQYTLTMIMSESMYELVRDGYPYSETYYNIRTESERTSIGIKDRIETLLKDGDEYTISSRLEEENSDVQMRGALRFVIAALAGILACIGISNVFSSTLGQLYQRKKEFARYLSVGLSPKGMVRILLLESCMIGLKPVIFSIFINIPLVAIALKAASISMEEFWMNAPVVPTVLFACFYLCFIGIAYYIGGKRILSENLIDVLKDETMI